MDSVPKPHSRIVFLAAVLIGVALILVGRLVHWQVFQAGSLRQLAAAESTGSHFLPAQRGCIYDRHGYPLAMNIFEYEISAAPPMLRNPYELADRLWPLLGQSREQVLRMLTQDRPYVLLEPHASREVGETIASWDELGLFVQPRPKRAYPEGPLAAHVLGFVNLVGKGYYGLEGYYDTALRGRSEDVEEVSGIPVAWAAIVPQDGQDLVLTLDRTIQYLVEQELAQAVEHYQAEGGTIIVMDPHTGAILAMASYPTYDPNNFAHEPPDLFVNPAVSSQYEPGSVFKIITLAAGLDTGLIRPDTQFYDSGVIEVGGRTIMNWDKRGHGLVTMTDVLAMSLNVGSAYVSTHLGAERFYNYLQRFGFGRPTGVDLDGEVGGTVRKPGDPDWHESDLGTNSFGQGVAVTPLQMVTAVAAVANGGALMQPYVVAQRVSGDGEVITAQPAVVRRPISAETARTLTEMLVEVVERQATRAAVPGYRIAGKTGTAQTPIPGGYDPNSTIASFVGYAPADDPLFIVLVKIDKPRLSPWGSEVAAPVFRRIAEQLFVLMGIPPQE